MTFTEEDIKDKDLLQKLVEQETTRIFESDAARKNRSYEQVYHSVKQGKVAEMHLVQSGKFEFANLKWHDLKNVRGEYCEVKAYDVDDWNAEYVQKDLQRYKKETWNKSTWYYLFQCRNSVYKLLAVLRIK